jgi:hypothetical protein
MNMNIYDPKNTLRGHDRWRHYRQTAYFFAQKFYKKRFVVPAAAFVLAIIVLGFAYVAGQQILRQGANDPQVQMATDAAAALGRGASAPAIVSSGAQIDIAESLSPFIMIFNSKGAVLQSSGVIKNMPPAPPRGMFTYLQKHNERRFTWEPAHGVRIAAVAIAVKGHGDGFVLVGRSLAETEKREAALFGKFFIAWLMALAAVVGGYIFHKKLPE